MNDKKEIDIGNASDIDSADSAIKNGAGDGENSESKIETAEMCDSDAVSGEADDDASSLSAQRQLTPEKARLQYSAYADMRPSPTSKYAPIGPLNYAGMLILTGIPAVGFIIAVIYALASKRAARKNFAVAILICRMLSLIFVFAFILISIHLLDTTPLDLLAKLGINISIGK